MARFLQTFAASAGPGNGLGSGTISTGPGDAMRSAILNPFTAHGKLLRLQTLVRLRWLAVAGQSAAVLGVSQVLGFPLPLGPCFALIALSAWLNIFLRIQYSASVRLPPIWAAMLLAYDIVQLGGLLYLTGGLANPFAFLLLVPVMVSAAALPVRFSIALAALVMVLASLLAVYRMPLPWFPGERLELPFVYITGVWASLAASLAFMGIYAWRIADEGRLMSDALAATELVLAREQHLSALDGLAAAAAHELGTPLATISVTASELLRGGGASGQQDEDLKLLKAQADRCKEILKMLTSMGTDPDRHFARLPISHLLEEVAEPHRGFGVDIEIRLVAGGGEAEPSPEPVGLRNPGTLYGLGNLVENAVDFARSKVYIMAEWNEESVDVVISDDGPGFSPEVMDHLGEPYVTSRLDGVRPETRHELPGEEKIGEFGLGLGFFIAKTLLERSGATIALRNSPIPGMGAVVKVTWPRQAMDDGPAADLS